MLQCTRDLISLVLKCFHCKCFVEFEVKLVDFEIGGQNLTEKL